MVEVEDIGVRRQEVASGEGGLSGRGCTRASTVQGWCRITRDSEHCGPFLRATMVNA